MYMTNAREPSDVCGYTHLFRMQSLAVSALPQGAFLPLAQWQRAFGVRLRVVRVTRRLGVVGCEVLHGRRRPRPSLPW